MHHHHHHQLRRSISLAQKSNLNRMTHAICYILLCTDTQEFASHASVILIQWICQDCDERRMTHFVFDFQSNGMLCCSRVLIVECSLVTIKAITYLGLHICFDPSVYATIDSEEPSYERIFLIFHREIHMFRTRSHHALYIVESSTHDRSWYAVCK